MNVTESALRKLGEDVGELLTRRARGRSLASFATYWGRPEAFAVEVLGAKLWSRQEHILAAVREHPLVVVQAANGVGKDYTAAVLALYWSIAGQGLVLAQAPTERQAVEIFMGEVRRLWQRRADLPGELFTRALRIPESEHAGILSMTSTDSSKLTGHHAPRVLVVLGEAQGLEDHAWEAALSVAVGDHDRILAYGNPLSPDGRYFAACRDGSGWERLKITAHECPNVVEGRTVIPGAVTRESIARFAQEYGVGSPLYLARIDAEFPTDADDGLIARRWLDAARERWSSGELEEAARGQAYVAGVDVARFGPDKTCVALRQGGILRDLVTWEKADTMATVGRVITLAEGYDGLVPTWRPARSDGSTWSQTAVRGPYMAGRLVIDEPGLGGGVIDRLREQQYRVVAFNGGRRAERPDKFANQRAETFWHLRGLLAEGRIALLQNDELWAELLAMRWKVTSTGMIAIEGKDEIRSRLGRSPDRADAVAMAFATYGRGGVPVIAPARW